MLVGLMDWMFGWGTVVNAYGFVAPHDAQLNSTTLSDSLLNTATLADTSLARATVSDQLV